MRERGRGGGAGVGTGARARGRGRADLDAAAAREPSDAGIRAAYRSLAALASRLRELERSARAEQAAALRGAFLSHPEALGDGRGRGGGGGDGGTHNRMGGAPEARAPADDEMPGLE